MKTFLNLSAFVLYLGLILSMPVGASISKELQKSVDEKQSAAARLINTVSTFANDRFTIERDKEDAQFAYSGFMARFESLREDREALERKEIMPDNATLEKYSKQYDRLIADLNAYLNKGELY